MVELQSFVFLENIIKLAIKVERQLKRNSTKQGVSRQVGNKMTNSYFTPLGVVSNWNAKRVERGDSSKQPASMSKEKESMSKEKEKVGDPNSLKRSRDIKCFKCLGHGHIASECLNKRVMVL